MPIELTDSDLRKIYRLGEEAVVELLRTFIDKINKLEEEVVKLKADQSKDSHNSSKPPSSDIHRPRPNPKSQRKKTKKRPGGQPGHRGVTLQRVENPDHEVPHVLQGRCACGRNLAQATIIDYERRQVTDIAPIVTEVTEHQAEIGECACGKIHTATFPKGVDAPVQYGNRLRTIALYLSIYQLVPQKRTTEFMEDIFDISMSQGTLNNIIGWAYDHLAPTEEGIKEAIQNSSVIHADETGMYVGGVRIWELTFSTADFTYYLCHENRGLAAIEASKVLVNYIGRLVHDGWPSYFDFSCLHALCNAHHLRELIFIFETYKQTWAQDMINLLCRIKKTVDRAKDNGRIALAKQTIRQYKKTYEKIIAAGLSINPENKRKPGQRGKVAQHPARNLLNRLNKYSDEVLAFMYDFNVPFDNNLAERDLRMSKIKQKVSGCFRSKKGADAFCRIRGYISTVRKHGMNVFEKLLQCFKNYDYRVLVPE